MSCARKGDTWTDGQIFSEVLVRRASGFEISLVRQGNSPARGEYPAVFSFGIDIIMIARGNINAAQTLLVMGTDQYKVYFN